MTTALLAMQQARLHWIELDYHIACCDERITAHVRSDTQAKASAQLGDCWGVLPRRNSSGGKTQLGRITKRGDDYLRTLLIQRAKSAVMTAHKRRDNIAQRLVQRLARVGCPPTETFPT